MRRNAVPSRPLQAPGMLISTAEHSHSGKRAQHFPLALDSVVWYGVYTFPKGATTAMEIFSIGQVARLSGVGGNVLKFRALGLQLLQERKHVFSPSCP